MSARARNVLLVCALLALAAPANLAAAAAPDNDAFAGARLVAPLPFADQVSTVEATMEPGEPSPGCIGSRAVDRSVWYHLPSPGEGDLTVDTTGSDFDTVLVLYRGTTLSDLVPVACADDSFGYLTSEVAIRTAPTADYWIQVSGWEGRAGNLVLGASFSDGILPPPPPCSGCPSLEVYPVPPEFARFAGETSIGVNRSTNAAMFLQMTQVLRARWDDAQSPPAVTWQDASGFLTSMQTMDPILWTDPVTGRTYVAQLGGPGSIIEYTDDDGETWVPTEPASVAPSFDHQTVGGGPYPAPLIGTVYPNAVYYCAQAGISQCARSDDGGLTWGAPLPMNTGACSGLHGHIVVAKDGTVVVPHGACGGGQGVIVSDDLGTTWQPRPVPGTIAVRTDPAISFDSAGRMYFVTSSGGHPVVATSDDDGRTWSDPVDVGAGYGIRNTEFPMAVAGGAGRAAFGFYGSRTPGNDQSADYAGVWHLYVSYTFDGGATWQTTDVTPTDPVQRGCIWMGGGSNPCRNLLDFQGITVDAQGRVLVGYADGCTSDLCVGSSGAPADSRDSRGAIARQTTGKRLFAEFDPPSGP